MMPADELVRVVWVIAVAVSLCCVVISFAHAARILNDIRIKNRHLAATMKTPATNRPLPEVPEKRHEIDRRLEDFQTMRFAPPIAANQRSNAPVTWPVLKQRPTTTKLPPSQQHPALPQQSVRKPTK